MSRRRSHSGFTLVEILVVLMILGLIGGFAIRGLRSIAKSDLRTSTAKMSGAIRFLFDRASTTGKYHRLVIDVDEGRYWAEVSDDKFYIPRDPETETWRQKRAEIEAKLDEDEKQKAELAEAAGSSDESKVKVQDFRPKRVRFGAFKSSTLKPVQMKNTRVMDVYTPRVGELITHGRAYIYFFPLGQSESAIVHLTDADDETIYSLVVHPITGRVKVYREYVQPPADDRIDDEGTVAQ
jgi:general secretion pathway protein H